MKRSLAFILLGFMLAFTAASPLQALAGRKLTVQGVRGEAVLPAMGPEGKEWLSLKDAVLFVGAKVTWKSTPRAVTINHQGHEYRLIPDHAFLYVRGTRRVPLKEGMQWDHGELLLSPDDLALLLREMGLQEIALAPAASEEIAGAVEEPGTKAEPQVQNEPEPQIVPPGPQAPERSDRGPVRVVVIDPGHGGKDAGAVGRKRTREKDICLDIAKRLKGFINRHEPKIKVILTRHSDKFISLKERAHIANQADADLFISIHANASKDRRARGTQVFFYDSQSSDKHAARLARSENADANMLDVIFTDLLKAQVRDDSIELATSVQKDLAKVLRLKTRRLHYAPFYVLAQTKMPSVLVESAFISNPDEEKLLRKDAFREQVALGIFRGLRKYRDAVNERR